MTAFALSQVRLVVELIWPLFLFFILIWVRSTNQPIYQGQCEYGSFFKEKNQIL